VPEPWLRAGKGTSRGPQAPICTTQTRDSNRFETGRNTNAQEIRYNAANFNKFLNGGLMILAG
jgi:hypothetical protein